VARVVDRVLVLRDEHPSPAQLLRLLVLRADVAGRLGDKETAAFALSRGGAVALTDAEREAVRDDLVRLDELHACHVTDD
jgi:hypothetical protein